MNRSAYEQSNIDMSAQLRLEKALGNIARDHSPGITILPSTIAGGVYSPSFDESTLDKALESAEELFDRIHN